MARPKKIDREQLLDAAEILIREKGASALTIDALARACGITKGGVQYTFSSKDEIIDAMFARWCQGYDAQFDAVMQGTDDPRRRVMAHVAATRDGDEAANAKAAGMMAVLLQTPEDLESTRVWYRERMRGLDASTPEGRRARLAFFATEGAFLLRYMRFMDIGPDEWEQVFADIEAMAEDKLAP